MASDLTNGVLDLQGKNERLVQKQFFLLLTERRGEIGAAGKEV
jgi:hypothetical protein